MKINIKSSKIELTPAIKDYVQEKMDMLEKNLGSIKVLNCDVEVGVTSNHHNKGEIYRTEVNLSLPGELLRVEKTEEDLYRSIDNVKDHLTMSIKKYKEKKIDRNRQVEDVEAEELMDSE